MWLMPQNGPLIVKWWYEVCKMFFECHPSLSINKNNYKLLMIILGKKHGIMSMIVIFFINFLGLRYHNYNCLAKMLTLKIQQEIMWKLPQYGHPTVKWWYKDFKMFFEYNPWLGTNKTNYELLVVILEWESNINTELEILFVNFFEWSNPHYNCLTKWV